MTRHPSPRASTRRRGLLTLLALGWALAGLSAAATPPEAAAPDAQLAARAPGAAVVAAQRRLDTVQGLLRQSEQALRETERLQDLLVNIDRRWQESTDARQAALAAAQDFGTQAMPALHAAQQAWASSSADVSRLNAGHQTAMTAVAQVPARQRAAAMAEVDAQATARAEAERAHRAARQRHHQAIDAAWRAADRATDRPNERPHIQEDLASQLADAAQRWTAVDKRWRALQRAVAADAALRPPITMPDGLTPAQAPWAVPVRPIAVAMPGPDTRPLDDWRAATKTLDQTQDAIWLRRDAAAFVRHTLAAAGACRTAACRAWQAEQRALAGELARLGTTLADTGARLAGAQARADSLPALLSARLAQANAQHEALAAAVAHAHDPGQPTLQALSATGRQTVASLALARQQATADFEVAWRAQYGQDPDRRESASDSAASDRSDLVFAAPSWGMAMPQLRQHALHRMTLRNDEPTGFGAYTYVVVGTVTGRESPGVRQRLTSLLAALQNLPRAEQIEADLRLGTNVFVVPVWAGTEDKPGLAYELRLAQALMSHVPPALLMPGRLQRALLTSNGPFLITLPGRLADAQAGWPVLFADLNSVPEAVVGDVVRSYMGDLLVGFQPSDAGWKPPALQRVALTLVRLVQGTGEVVMAAFPAAMAAPAPR